MKRLTVAVTGMNATDNPAPGVPVIRALRAAAGANLHIVGLAYDALDPGNFMEDVADDVYLIPYPSQGADVVYERLAEIHAQTPIDMLLPTLDSELSALIKLQPRLAELGIHTLLPDAQMLRLRAKDRLADLDKDFGIRVPRSVALLEESAIAKLEDQLSFPVMVKGQFYDAAYANSAMEVLGHFRRIQAKWGVPIIAQEFVAGPEYDVVALGDGQGGLVGAVPMRKMQLTDKGKAWGGVTIADPKLDAFVAKVMAALRWRGPCEVEVIREQGTGEYHLIEINPRFPAWVYLAVGAGRNLPWATVQLAMGERVAQMQPSPAGVMFLRHSYDQICDMQDYEAMSTHGELHKGVRGAASDAETVAETATAPDTVARRSGGADHRRFA